MTNLPPMPVRAFRDEFLRKTEPTFELPWEKRGEDQKRGHFEHDPYERCDFDGEED